MQDRPQPKYKVGDTVYCFIGIWIAERTIASIIEDTSFDYAIKPVYLFEKSVFSECDLFKNKDKVLEHLDYLLNNLDYHLDAIKKSQSHRNAPKTYKKTYKNAR